MQDASQPTRKDIENLIYAEHVCVGLKMRVLVGVCVCVYNMWVYLYTYIYPFFRSHSALYIYDNYISILSTLFLNIIFIINIAYNS